MTKYDIHRNLPSIIVIIHYFYNYSDFPACYQKFFNNKYALKYVTLVRFS